MFGHLLVVVTVVIIMIPISLDLFEIFTCVVFMTICGGTNQQQCSSDSSWFFKVLPPTTSDITVRVCRDHARDVGDIALTQVELYIQ